MSDVILAAVITACATLGAPAIGYVVNGIYQSSKTHLFKKGDKFKGEWKFDNSKETIYDEIFVNSTWFGRIKCTGKLNFRGSSKSYKLIGKQYKYCVTFEYLGTDNNNNHDETAGIIIIDSSVPNRDLFIGRWSQLNIDGQLIGGSMKLVRTI